jgi:hypothetical protein
MLAAFLVTTLAHTFQAIKHRKSFCWVIIMSCLWQTLAYVFRVLSIKNPDNLPLYALWFVLILVSEEVHGFSLDGMVLTLGNRLRRFGRMRLCIWLWEE